MSRKKLLVIADDWERLERYEDHLRKNFEFHSSPFGSHGIEMAIEQKPDIILVDLEFEDMTEAEALSAIRDRDELQDTLVILLSHEAKLESSRNTKVFTRPVSLQSLVSFLESNAN